MCFVDEIARSRVSFARCVRIEWEASFASRARERDKEFSRVSAVFFPSSMRGGFFLENLYARAVEVDARVRCARARSKRAEIDVLRAKNGFVSMERRVECVFGAGFRNRFFVSGALMGLSFALLSRVFLLNCCSPVFLFSFPLAIKTDTATRRDRTRSASSDFRAAS